MIFSDGSNDFYDGSNDFWCVEGKCFMPLVPMFASLVAACFMLCKLGCCLLFVVVQAWLLLAICGCASLVAACVMWGKLGCCLPVSFAYLLGCTYHW